MDNHSLLAVSPIDGRYARQTGPLKEYFSEYALIRYRIRVEIEYFIALCGIPLPQLSDFDNADFGKLRDIYRNFTPEEAARVKEIEKVTNHDVKAVEYFIKEKFKEMGIMKWGEFVHFGLTSQDINNTAIPLSIKEAAENSWLPLLEEVLGTIRGMAEEWKDVPMADRFVSSLGLRRSSPTTQIEHYDNLAAIFDNMRRINTILIDMSRDIWTYISMEYFKQKVNRNEVGSSAMPHKVNPIDFENAEGNLGMADVVLTFLSMKLPISRLQRDLTDSTVLRNVGVPFAHGAIALNSLKKGLGKLILNREAIAADLERNWAVVAEGIQTILRRENYPNPYETLKALTRTGSGINHKTISDFIDGLDVSSEVKEELRAITPETYTGF